MKPDTTKHVCIHGHFYQPPRENPWLEEIEREESASPFHDWNERIAEECYKPNAAARILDDGGLIGALKNNYDYLSFNYGPTLLRWMERPPSCQCAAAGSCCVERTASSAPIFNRGVIIAY